MRSRLLEIFLSELASGELLRLSGTRGASCRTYVGAGMAGAAARAGTGAALGEVIAELARRGAGLPAFSKLG